ncbi:hypothetical protein ABTN14_20130, partial [Acinetobacter baumannii]
LPPANADYIQYTPDVMNNVTEVDVFDSTGAKVLKHNTVYDPLNLNQLYQDVGALPGEVTNYQTYGDGSIKQITDPLG